MLDDPESKQRNSEFAEQDNARDPPTEVAQQRKADKRSTYQSLVGDRVSDLAEIRDEPVLSRNLAVDAVRDRCNYKEQSGRDPPQGGLTVVDEQGDQEQRHKENPKYREDICGVEHRNIVMLGRRVRQAVRTAPRTARARVPYRSRIVADCHLLSVSARFRASLADMENNGGGAESSARIDYIVRRARTADVPKIKRLVDIYAPKILLEKNLVTLYESVQEFWVAEHGDAIISCGALHVLWSDLGEVRTVAVDPGYRGCGAGRAVVTKLINTARDLGLQRVFVLTFEVDFFSQLGFTEIDGTPVTAEVFAEMRRSYDTGVAEFLDLSYVKPNTLGNTRMLLKL